MGGDPNSKTEAQIFDECKIKLATLARKKDKIVIIFNRFDQLSPEFDKQFLANLRSFRNIDPDKIVMIFTANRPIYEIASGSIIGTNLYFYSRIFYLGRYNRADLIKLLYVNKPNLSISQARLNKLVDLSGGHNQLLNILINSEIQENPLLDKFVKLQLKELYDFLNYHQQIQVQKIALKKTLKEIDPFLINIGMVTRDGPETRLFTPLLEEYIKSYITINIPAKEARLFKLLKRSTGKVVSKDEIFGYVWQKDYENASDWALNALIYRLRKNPGFISSGYVIENYKKIGYVLNKS